MKKQKQLSEEIDLSDSDLLLLDNAWDDTSKATTNVFCPTKKGGGVDPTCGKGGTKGRSEKQLEASSVAFKRSETANNEPPSERAVQLHTKAANLHKSISDVEEGVVKEIHTRAAATHYKKAEKLKKLLVAPSFEDGVSGVDLGGGYKMRVEFGPRTGVTMTRAHYVSIKNPKGKIIHEGKLFQAPPGSVHEAKQAESDWMKYEYHQWLLMKHRRGIVTNVFCATGKGGGVKPTCKVSKRQTKHPTQKNPAAKLKRKLNLDGGATYLVTQHEFHKGSGYAVSPYPERSRVFNNRVGKDDIHKFLEDNKDLLDKKDHACGAFKDTDGKIFLDVSIVTKDKNYADELGRKYNQRSYYDFETGLAVDTGGTGEETVSNLFRREHNGRRDGRPTENAERRLICCAVRIAQGLPTYSDSITNVFCPTGSGGGINPTCSPKGASHGSPGIPAGTQPRASEGPSSTSGDASDDGLIGRGRIGSDGRRVYPGTLSEVPSKEYVSGVARSYVEKHKKELGLNDVVDTEPVLLDTRKSREIGQYYEDMPATTLHEPVTREAYEQLAKETVMQYKHMIDNGMKVHFMEDDPYPSAKDMMDDVGNNKHLRVFLTSKDSFGSSEVTYNHPLLEPTGIMQGGRELVVNDLFRAVHDYFGHASEGNQFGRVGEERAWAKHSRMFSETARRAMSSETRGQNSWVNYGPHMFDKDGWRGNKKHPNFIHPKDRPYAEQKVGLLPDDFVTNIFCATGRGGGIDATCGKADTGGSFGSSGSKVPPPTVLAAVMDGDTLTDVPHKKKQPSIVEAVAHLAKKTGNNIDLSDEKISEEDITTVATGLAADAVYAHKNSNHQAGWYSKDIEKAIYLMGEDPLNHKELQTGDANPKPPPAMRTADDHKFAFAACLALTSPEADVLLNGRDAEFLYNNWKTTGKFHAEFGFTAKQAKLPKQMLALQALVDNHGLARTQEMLLAKYKVKDLNAKGEHPEFMGLKIAGVGAETDGIPGFSVFGPKLGAFFANIRGKSEHTTIDMWEMRHIGMITGRPLKVPTKKLLRSQADTVEALLSSGKLTELHGVSREALLEDLKLIKSTGRENPDGPLATWAVAQQKIYSTRPGINKKGEQSKSYGNPTDIDEAANSIYERGKTKSHDAPKTVAERTNIMKVYKDALDLAVKEVPGLTAAELQAVSWTFTQRVLKKAGARVSIDDIDVDGTKLEKTFSNSIQRILDKKTVRRVSWEQDVKAETKAMHTRIKAKIAAAKKKIKDDEKEKKKMAEEAMSPTKSRRRKEVTANEAEKHYIYFDSEEDDTEEFDVKNVLSFFAKVAAGEITPVDDNVTSNRENDDMIDTTYTIINNWSTQINNRGTSTGSNCGISKGGFQKGNKCAKGGKTAVTKSGEVLHLAKHVKGEWTIDGKPVPPHLKNLGIAVGGPKALKEVYMNLDPKGMLLAKGRDVKGRVQPKYSDTHNAQSAASKFGRVKELRAVRASILKDLEKDAKDPELKDRADCLSVVMRTGMRPGSTKDTGADYKSYGATTLEGRHVIANKDGTVTLRLVTGKNKGNTVDFPITDKKVARMLIARSKQAGPDGKMFNVSATKLRDYSKTKGGGGFKTKDHRTALGTDIAVEMIKKIGTKKKFETFKEYREAITTVSTAASKVLGNTPKMCEKYYIDLTVFGAWQHPPAPVTKAKSSKKGKA